MIALTYYPENRPENRTELAVQKEVAAKAVDSDKDGVLESRDACPGTPVGTKVNRLGCALKSKIEIKITVEFDTGSDVIKPEYLDEVARVAGLLNEHPDQNAVIAGHTDSAGDLNKNIELSELRAQSIVSKLVEAHGVSANRLKAIGYGPKIPIASNDTPEGRALNRRVIVELSGE
jgi:OOP family OmpA-OmpF porin